MTFELRLHLPAALVEADVSMLQHRLIAIPGVLDVTLLESAHCVIVRLHASYDTVLSVKRVVAHIAQSHGGVEQAGAGRSRSGGPSEAHIG